MNGMKAALVLTAAVEGGGFETVADDDDDDEGFLLEWLVFDLSEEGGRRLSVERGGWAEEGF